MLGTVHTAFGIVALVWHLVHKHLSEVHWHMSVVAGQSYRVAFLDSRAILVEL